MTKKYLYLIIALLGFVLLYMLFVPEQKQKIETYQKTELQIPAQIENTESSMEVGEQTSPSVKKDAIPEEITLLGVFVGFVDGTNVHKKKYKYMLLNDGMEVLRIDLRPLVGYSDLNLLEKLGVKRGDDVKVIGVMNKEKFLIQSVE